MSMQINNYSTAKLAVWNKQTFRAEYTNSSGNTVDLARGTVMAINLSTGKLIPFDSTLNNGGQRPVGVLLHAQSVANGDTVTLTIVVKGSVAAEQLVFAHNGDTLDTIVGGLDNSSPPEMTSDATVRWHLIGIGIIPVQSTELTGYDNQ